MGELGWAYMGRPARDGLMYFTMAPFGVFYDLRKREGAIVIVQVVDARYLRERP